MQAGRSLSRWTWHTINIVSRAFRVQATFMRFSTHFILTHTKHLLKLSYFLSFVKQAGIPIFDEGRFSLCRKCTISYLYGNRDFWFDTSVTWWETKHSRFVQARGWYVLAFGVPYIHVWAPPMRGPFALRKCFLQQIVLVEVIKKSFFASLCQFLFIKNDVSLLINKLKCLTSEPKEKIP